MAPRICLKTGRCDNPVMSEPTREDPIHDPNPAQREAVRRAIAQFQARLQVAGIEFREPPPEPTSCCGRGCNGCVWESYEAALIFWYEDGGALLAG